MSTLVDFNRVTYGLPVETFRISAHIALEERLPVVTEFVLRLLRICGKTNLSDIRSYFGFTDSETLSLIESLVRQGLIELQEEEACLTAFAIERFDEAGGDYPRFSKVELKQDTVTFDLRSFTPLKSERGVLPTDNIIKLEAEDEVLGSSVERAKSAYRQRYPEIASMREDLREQSHGVYSIEDIESKRRSYVPIPVTFSMDDEGQAIRTFDEAFERIAPRSLLQFLNEQVTGSIPRTISLKHSGLEEFIDAFNMRPMNRYIVGSKFDLNSYLRDVQVEKTVPFPNGVTPLVGNLYLPENRERIANRIGDRRAGRRRHGKLLTSLAWMVPDYDLWGRGEAFSAAVSIFNGSLRDPGTNDDLHLFASTESGAESFTTNRFRVNGLKNLHFVHQTTPLDQGMNGRLELLFYPTAFVAALFHISMPGNPGLWVPVGFISTNPKHVDTAHKLICRRMRGNGYAGMAKFRATNRDQQRRSFEETCTFLNYESVLVQSSNHKNDLDGIQEDADT